MEFAGLGAHIAKTPTNTILCYRTTMSTSTGIFLGEMPLQTTVPLLFAQIITIFAATRLSHALLRHLGFPEAISHVIAGIVLGPSFLMKNDNFRNLLFPMHSWVHLNMIALLAFLLFIFVVGVKTDLSVIHKSGQKAVGIGLISTAVPFALVLVISRIAAPPSFNEWRIITLLATRWSTTSNTVLASLLDEFKLLTSNLGRLALSASLVSEFSTLLVATTGFAWVLATDMKSAAVGVGSFAAFAAYMGAVVLASRVALWLVRQTPEEGPMEEARFVAVLVLAIGLGLVGEVIGQHAMVGPLLLGLLLPGGPPLGTTLALRVERLALGLFLPVYLAITGFKTDMAKLGYTGGGGDGPAAPGGYSMILFATSVVGKMLGALGPCLYCGMPLADAFTIALMMCSKGIIEIHFFSSWQEAAIITGGQYSRSMLAILVVGGISAALLKHLYKPSMCFFAYRRRTIEHSRRTDELRLLLCVHHSEDVPPLFSFLEISHPSHDSPLCAYLLHLSPLAGRSTAILAPYKKRSDRRRHRRSFEASSVVSAESDHIVNAFRFLERHYTGKLFLHPFICLAPYTTMHHDVCSLALDKKVTLVVLPFHRHVEIAGTTSSTAKAAIQAMNVSVLSFAPCSVAILVDHGLSSSCPPGDVDGPVYQIGLFFFGGPDDREALAFAGRVAANPSVGLTVVRFVLPEAAGSGGERSREEMLDEEAVEEFKAEGGTSDGVVYRVAEVAEGPEMVEVMKEMCEECMLLIVGRRQGMESAMPAGLEMWSECPELGVVGDMLASTDFGGKVSTLVVQQQARVAAGEVNVDEKRDQPEEVPTRKSKGGYQEFISGEAEDANSCDSSTALRGRKVHESNAFDSRDSREP